MSAPLPVSGKQMQVFEYIRNPLVDNLVVVSTLLDDEPVSVIGTVSMDGMMGYNIRPLAILLEGTDLYDRLHDPSGELEREPEPTNPDDPEAVAAWLASQSDSPESDDQN